MTPANLHALLSRYRYRFGTEKELQDDVERAMEAEVVPFVRECRTSTGPIDFLASGSVGVECKIAGGPSAVLDQLIRYAAEPEISGIVLVTSRAGHRFRETALGGKPFLVLWIAGQL